MRNQVVETWFPLTVGRAKILVHVPTGICTTTESAILHESLEPAPAIAYGEHVDQILTNLLSNAVKYCHPGDEVKLSTGEANGFAVVRVEDRGPGIAAEHLPHFFDRFYRADASRNRSSGGAGLGLAICIILVEAQGGTITVESVVGQGTAFTIAFPAQQKTP